MQQMGQTAVQGGVERRRVEAVVETLAALHGRCESLEEVAHDARNMVTALGLYCDLLEEPGVLAAPFHHYGDELRLVATASRRLVEKLVELDTQETPEGRAADEIEVRAGKWPAFDANGKRYERAGMERREGKRSELRDSRGWGLQPAVPVDSMAAELTANRNLLEALAGPSTTMTLSIEGGALPVRLTGEDLTRVLVNLVKNAAEAMPGGGRIALGLHEFHAGAQATPWVILTVEDSGPGIPAKAMEEIFEAGYSTRKSGSSAPSGWASAHRGLGLSISRSIVESAGGRIHATNRVPIGARFEIELPVRTR
jgi:signal transduction histidine kinase